MENIIKQEYEKFYTLQKYENSIMRQHEEIIINCMVKWAKLKNKEFIKLVEKKIEDFKNRD